MRLRRRCALMRFSRTGSRRITAAVLVVIVVTIGYTAVMVSATFSAKRLV